MKRQILPAYRIAYLRRTGAYGAENGAVMERLIQLTAQAGLLDENAVLLSIAWDDPTQTAPADCRYDACLVLAEDTSLPDAAAQYPQLPGGAYAVFDLPHTAQALTEAWVNIARMAREHGFAVDESRPVLERYRADRTRCEFCIPCSG